MKNAYSLFGTGIVPFKLGRSLSNRNGFYAAETTCPICGARNKDVSQLYRQYLGILYIPVLPLWLASCAECCTRYRLRMKCSELEYLASILNIGANGKYWKPLAISILGFLFGYFMLFFVFTLPPIVCIPVILVASSILNLLRIVEGFAYATAFFGKDGRSVDRRMKALTKLYLAIDRAAPFLLFVIAVLATWFLGPRIPHLFGAIWGCFFFNSFFLFANINKGMPNAG